MIEVTEYEMLLSARLFVLQRAVATLIVSHPDPAKFAQLFDSASTIAQIEHITVPNATERVRAEATRFAQGLLGVALDERDRRLQQKPPKD